MGIFDKIKDAIWGTDDLTPSASHPDPIRESYLGTDQATTGAIPEIERDASVAANSTVGRPTQTASAPVQTPQARGGEIDVAAQLDRAVKARGQQLNWRTSIVDLMKVVGMDASLEERRDLARELNYTGDVGDTAAMNMFLHRALMKRLAENGGKVPAEFLD